MTPTQRLAEMETLLAQIVADPDANCVKPVAAFMEHCFHLDIGRRTGLAAQDSAALDAHLQKSASDVQSVAITFDTDGGEAVRLFVKQEFVGNDWVTLCLRRSHVEAFNDLYRDLVSEDDLIDTEDLDDDIRAKAELELLLVPDRVPPDLPDSHWWWQLT